MGVSEWADRHRVLETEFSNEAGPWRSRRTPYLREIMDAIADRAVRQVTIMKSTQVGGTEAMLNQIGWVVEQDPGPMMLVLPTKNSFDEVNRRVRRMFECSPALSAHVTGWKTDWKTRTLRLDTCALRFCSSQSPDDLAKFATRYLFGDEAAKWAPYAGAEAPPLHLAEERQRTFGDRAKTVLASTPVRYGDVIETQHRQGDQRKFHVPCHACSTFQVLLWERVRWEGGLQADGEAIAAADAAGYLCEHCETRWSSRDRDQALQRGVWVPQGGSVDRRGRVRSVPAGSHRSYHLWAAYSPWLTFGQLVAKYLQLCAEGNLQHWVNSWLGEPWEETIDEPTREGVARCRGDYERGELPLEAQVLVAGVDVQKRELYYVVRAFGYDEESWLVAEGTVRSWDHLGRALLEQDHHDRQGKSLRLRLALIDIGWKQRRAEALDFCRLHPDVLKPSLGMAHDDTPVLYRAVPLDRDPDSGKVYKRALRAFHLNTTALKDKLAAHVALGPLTGQPRAFHVHRNPEDRYLRQMGAEKKIAHYTPQRRQRRELWVVKRGHRANHYWDCEVMAFGAGAMLQVHRLRRDQAPRRRGPPRSRAIPAQQGVDPLAFLTADEALP